VDGAGNAATAATAAAAAAATATAAAAASKLPGLELSSSDGRSGAAAAAPALAPNNETPNSTPTSHTVIASLTSGAMAGAIAKTVIAPLDRTKIYFQTHPERGYRFKRALRYIHTTYRTEGFLFLWRGNSATMARIVPYASVQFLAHDQYKRILGIHTEHNDKPKKPSSSSSNDENQQSSSSRKLRHFMAGSLAGMTGQTLTYPLDRARAVMAVTRIGEYKNLMDVFRRTIRNEGVTSLYRGFVPTIIGVIPYAGTSFLTYEQLKAFWTARNAKMAAAAEADGSATADHHYGPTALQRLSSGAFAGLLGQTSSYPLDIVRRRMQTATQMGVSQNKYATILGTLTVILRKEGIRKGWFKGVSMNFIKGPIAVGISFTTYDYFSYYIKKLLQESTD